MRCCGSNLLVLGLLITRRCAVSSSPSIYSRVQELASSKPQLFSLQLTADSLIGSCPPHPMLLSNLFPCGPAFCRNHFSTCPYRIPPHLLMSAFIQALTPTVLSLSLTLASLPLPYLQSQGPRVVLAQLVVIPHTIQQQRKPPRDIQLRIVPSAFFFSFLTPVRRITCYSFAPDALQHLGEARCHKKKTSLFLALDHEHPFPPSSPRKPLA